MIVFIAVLLTISTFIFIAYPLFRQRATPVDSADDDKLQGLNIKRDTAYSMLKELEFDFHSGILSEEDYLDLEKRYEQKAISILKDTDKLEKGTDIDEEIEKQVAGLRQSKKRFCPQCGTKHDEGDRFCSHCGTEVKQGESGD
ncbi:zinc-ribbon domain-containing protein [Chloroflexota bacterium]